jgi:hypothetical protein
VAAALAVTALVAAVPFLSWDRVATDGARGALVRGAPEVVAVGLTGEDIGAVLAAAQRGGPAVVLPPTTDPLPAARLAPTGRVSARALLDGTVPPSVLAGRVVVVDTPPRAAARAAEQAVARTRLWPARELAAVLAGLVALGAALAVGRARARGAWLAVGGTTLVAAGAVLVAAALGVIAPVAELALLVPLAAFGGSVDRARALARTLDGITGPLLRATARRGAAARVDVELVGPALAELLGARGLMVLAVQPGEREARVVAGWRMAPHELRAGALDVRRAPLRDPSGVARPADAQGMLAEPSPATALPLVASGHLEGWLLVAHAGPASALDGAPAATVEICETLAGELRAARLRAGRDPARALVAAATSLDEETGALAEAAARARTGLALLAPTGATSWKNVRFDDSLSDVAPRASSDLARVLALFRRVGEMPLDTLQRLLSGGATRVAAPELGIVASATRAGGSLLVEIDALDAETSAVALSPAPTIALREPAICAALGGSAEASTYPIG